MQETAIAWTDVTWNPTFGCSKVSSGCAFCYAETIALKFKLSPSKWTVENEARNVMLKPHKLHEPYGLKQPSRIFVNSMSDLFHPHVPDDYIHDVMAVMRDLPQHRFQVLTKRPERAARWSTPMPENMWMGATVESASVTHRIDLIRQSPASVRFLSIEPLLSRIPGINLGGIDWVIVGGESGNHMASHPERWMNHAWAREIRDACMLSGTAFFFKQSSAYRTEMGTAMEEGDGSAWEWRQFPGLLNEPVQVRPASR